MSTPGAGRWRWPAALIAVALFHLGLTAYFAPPHVMFSKEPVLVVDYALHAYQVDRAVKAFNQAHALWGYDPQVLAGQPAGVVEDLTSKGTELFVIGMNKLGVAPGAAFNLFILLTHLSVPLLGYAAARLFELSRRAALASALLWVLLWFFDSFMHWAWWVGMISWSLASLLGVVFLGLLQRALDAQQRRWFVLAAFIGAVLSLVHPFAVLSIAVAALWIYLRAFKSLSRRSHALYGLVVLCGALTALVWIGPALRFRHYIGDADTFFRTTLSFALYDFLDLVRDGEQTGSPVRTLFRWLCFAGALVMLLRWRRQGDRRVLVFAAGIIPCLVLSYFAAYFWVGRQTQPYRQVGPAMLLAALPAAELLTTSLDRNSLKQLSSAARALLAICVVLIVPRVYRTIAQYVPELLPQRELHLPIDLLASPLENPGEPRPAPMRHLPPPEHYKRLAAWLRENHGGRGRIVVSEWITGEYLATATNLPILGGLVERNVPHVDAQLFRRKPGGDLPGNELREYFERYAVGWVVLSGLFQPLDKRRDLLEPVTAIADYRVYRTRIEPSYFARGKGRVASQGFNRIEVAEASGPEVVLRFHWMETLRCEPNCQVERQLDPGDRVGFIRVPNPPPAFVIKNTY